MADDKLAPGNVTGDAHDVLPHLPSPAEINAHMPPIGTHPLFNLIDWKAPQPFGNMNDDEAQAVYSKVTEDTTGLKDPDGKILFGTPADGKTNLQRLKDLATPEGRMRQTSQQLRDWMAMDHDAQIAAVQKDAGAMSRLFHGTATGQTAKPAGGLELTPQPEGPTTGEATPPADQQAEQHQAAHWESERQRHEDELISAHGWMKFQNLAKVLHPDEMQVVTDAIKSGDVDKNVLAALPIDRREMVGAAIQNMKQAEGRIPFVGPMWNATKQTLEAAPDFARHVGDLLGEE